MAFLCSYHKLNSVAHRDAYPLPRIDATLDSLSGCNSSGYWQVALGDTGKEKTAFSTSQGHFEFGVVPFGLAGAPAAFRRLKECVLSGLATGQCLV